MSQHLRIMTENRFSKLHSIKCTVSKTSVKCLIILILLISRHSVKAQTCNGGTTTFEKISESKLDPQQSQTQVIISGFPVLLDCINLCNRSTNCNVFNMDYQLGQCIQVDIREGRRDLIKRNPSNNYFAKICLHGITDLKEICGDRLWAFDRIIGGSLVGFDDKEERNVLNRTECERLCLTENSFVCRSAEYDILTTTCILSRETRRTQPQAFIIDDDATIDYLENQCSTQSVNLVGCPYETRRDTSLVATESSYLASSESECQTSCDQSRFFICRAYTYIPVRRACYISSDDSTSFPNIITQQGTFFGERKCPEQCTAGIITYEKLTGYYLQNAQREVLTNRPREYTENCLVQCKTNETPCPSVLIDYVNSICYKLDRTSQGRDSDLFQFQPGGLSYFEKVCLQGRTQSCNNKLWAFERVLNHELRGYDDLVLKYVQSRHQCEEACIQETQFHCRSAEYDYTSIECKLSREDRRTKPLSFVATSRKVDYLENQCTEERSNEDNCNYTEVTTNGAPMYVDAIIFEVETLEDCQESCDNEQTFECRSLGYRSSNQECLLSGDDIISGGRVAVAQSPDSIYSEKQCEIEIDNETMTTTEVSIPSGVTHPFPFTPPTQETLPEFPTTSASVAGIGRCKGGVGKTEYEKTTGYKITVELSLLHDGGGNLGISNECIIKCNVDPNCQGFILDYNSNKCYSLHNDPSLNRELLQRGQSISYFEPVCYQVSSGCGKLWTFERFYRKQLKVAPQESIQDISKVDCEQRCLKETKFTCRSANYDVMKQECHLNSEDRFTQSITLSDSPSNDYLENQCYPFGLTNPAITRMGLSYSSRQSTTTTTVATTVDHIRLHPRKSSGICYFDNEESTRRLSYVERTLNVATEFECQAACELETSFNCRSYAFVKSSGYGSSQCYLSADTKNSLGAEMRSQTSSTYAERVCPKDFFPFPKPALTPIPPFPPRKLFPPTPFALPHPYPKPYPKPLPPPPPPPPPSSSFYPYPVAPSPMLPPPPSASLSPLVPPSYKPFPVLYPNLGQPYPYAPPPYSGQFNPTSTSNTATVRNGQIFPLPGPITYVGPTRCFSQMDATFERVTRLASQGYGSEVRINQQQPTLDCLRECLTFGDQCQAVTFKSNFHGYSPPCTIFNVPAGGSLTPPTMESNAAYFQKICIPGFKCEKAWTFDRVPFFHLDGYDDLELQNINSKEECETACIQQIAFPCRSAEYFYNKGICRLSRETRRSQPYAFQHYGDGVEYLENQCHSEPGFCGYVEFPNKFLPYYDRRIYGLIDLYECQMACVRESVFNCRSASFDDKTKECFLGSCDRFCGYETVDRVYMTYSERVTCGYDLKPLPLNIATAVRYTSVDSKFQQLSKSSALTKQSAVTSGCDVTMTVSYERTTGYAPLMAHNRLLPTSRVRGVTQECIKQCSDLGFGCQAFVLVYFPPPSLSECLVYAQSAALQASLPESELLQNKPDVVFFEKICLKGIKCDGKLWVFDRMFGHQLKTGYFMTYEAIGSRKECEDLCLKFVNYPCRSALYSASTLTCKLNTESRHTNSANFQYIGGDIQYLENQCV